MREWVVKLLGGFVACDPREVEFFSAIADWKKEAEFWRALVEKKDEEIQRLSNLIFTRAGFITNEASTNATQPKHEPINSRPSWKQIQRNLEKEDARKLADETERRWKNKPGAMPVGTGTDEDVSSRKSVAS